MSSLHERLKSALAFDERYDSTGGDDPSIKYLHAPRRSGLEAAMIAIACAADKTQTHWECSGCNYPDLPHDCDVLERIHEEGRVELANALATLERELMKLEGV